MVIDNEDYLEKGKILYLESLQDKKIMLDGARVQNGSDSSDWIKESNYDEEKVLKLGIRYRIRLAFRRVFLKQKVKE